MREKSPFLEVINYINEVKSEFNINVYEYDSMGIVNQAFMKKSIQNFVNNHGISHIISGTRSTDPFTQNLQVFSKSDKDLDWPEVMRVLPLYNWSYKEIWRFIIDCELPYCSMYNMGYTYIGDQLNTIRNPFLSGKHAKFGNDNIELFSRKGLLDDLPKEGNKYVFGKINIIFCIIKPESLSFQIDFDLLNQSIHDFCNKNGCTFNSDANLLQPMMIGIYKNEDREIFEEMILFKKRAPGNFKTLYLGVIYHPDSKKVSVFI